jgi:orotidine-5'-phosphate decarboxylase
MTISFGDRLTQAFDTSGHLCVGIDPHPYLLEAWNLPISGPGAREFGLRVVEAAVGRAGIVKPQVAFFERHGSAGYAALEATLQAARDAGILVIADAKRGDLGSSVEAYGQAWLTPGSPLEADSMTISAYQGVGSLAEPIALALDGGKGLFVLAATSNPESFDTQRALVQSGDRIGLTVAASIVDEMNTAAALATGDGSRESAGSLNSFGFVIGATVSLADYGITDTDLLASPILAPGFGFQGADADSVHRVYGAAAHNVVVSSSRAILDAGPTGVATAIELQVAELDRVFSK